MPTDMPQESSPTAPTSSRKTEHTSVKCCAMAWPGWSTVDMTLPVSDDRELESVSAMSMLQLTLRRYRYRR